MAHRIGKREDIGEALKRLVEDDLAGAQAEFGGEAPAEVRVHRVRQRLKRLRTMMRVEAPILGDRADKAKRDLSAAARLLAGARDADAAAASARELKESVGDDDGAAGLDRVVATLDRQAAAAHKAVPPVDEVIERLAAVEADLAAAIIDVDIDGATLFEEALVSAYRRGRRAMQRAESSLTTPDLHRWRKTVKELWHLVRLGRKRLPPQADRLAKRLQKLGDLLGFDHDHAVLAEKLALSPHHDPALMRQLHLIARERRSLETKAFALGNRVYKRRPGEFATRLRVK